MDTASIVAAFLSIAFIGAIVNGFLLWILAKIVGGESAIVKSIGVSLLIFMVKIVFQYILGISEWWTVPVSLVLFVFSFHITIWRAMILGLLYWSLDFFFIAIVGILTALFHA